MDLSVDFGAAITAAYAAGEIILEYKAKGFDVKMNADKTPVTSADIASNNIIQAKLKRRGYPILSEETMDDKARLESPAVWIVDPLDGTKAFIEGKDNFSVAIGLAIQNKAVIGVVYQPVTDTLYTGVVGNGAYKQAGKKIEKLQVNGKGLDAIITHGPAEVRSVMNSRFSDIKCTHDVGSAALYFSEIASGSRQAYILAYPQSGQWDTCAAEVILREAGGEITDMQGNRIAYNQPEVHLLQGCVGTNKKVHDEVLKRIKS